MKHLLILALLLALNLTAQIKFSVDQLISFVKSSVRLKHPDAQVAAYLKKVNLSEQLPPGKIEELLASGMGPKTYEQLQVMVAATASLPAPKVSVAVAEQPVTQLIPPPSFAEQRALIEQLREYSLNYDKTLPDFLCTQVTRRFYDPSGLEYWVNADTITSKLSYFQRKEEKKVLFVNNQYKENIDWDKLGGASSTGEFGDMLREIFERDTEASFQWERWGTLRRKRVHVIRYTVQQSHSKWAIVYEKSMTIRPAYTGLVYADASNGMIMRVTLEALDMPASFPVQVAKNQLDYDYTDISGNTFLLPLRAEMRMREGKLLIRNDIEFRNYRKFGADTSITFDTPEPLAEEMVNETPNREVPKETSVSPKGSVTRDIPKETGTKPRKP
jgi:hypothetical protein